MNRTKLFAQPSLTAILLLAVVLTSGCSLFAHTPQHSDPPVQRRAPPFDSLGQYTAYLSQLTTANASELDALLEQVSHEYDTAPSANAQLHMALALVALPPPKGNLTRGSELLKELLAPAGQLPAPLEDLATAMLAMAGQQHNTRQSDQATLDKLHQVEKQLQEARHKIKALTKIEQTIEQPPAGPKE